MRRLKELVNLLLRRQLCRAGDWMSQQAVDLAFEQLGGEVILFQVAQVYGVAVGTGDDGIEEAGVGISTGCMPQAAKVHDVGIKVDQIQRAGRTPRTVIWDVLRSAQ